MSERQHTGPCYKGKVCFGKEAYANKLKASVACFFDGVHKVLCCLAVLEPDDDRYLAVLILLKLLDVNLSVNVFLDDLLHFLFCDVLFPNHNLNILADDLW